jgi:hypothetical protein
LRKSKRVKREFFKKFEQHKMDNNGTKNSGSQIWFYRGDGKADGDQDANCEELHFFSARSVGVK